MESLRCSPDLVIGQEREREREERERGGKEGRSKGRGLKEGSENWELCFVGFSEIDAPVHNIIRHEFVR